MIDGPEVRQLDAQELAAVFDLDQWAFGFDTEGDDEQPARALLGAGRVHGAHLDGVLRGAYTVLPQDLPVPGGSVPAAGVTWVGVHPAARRRGVLTAMMRHHLEGRSRGRPRTRLDALRGRGADLRPVRVRHGDAPGVGDRAAR